MTLARYAPVSREVKPPRPACPACKAPMWFDGCYWRKVPQAGVVHELVVHRVRCPRCRAGQPHRLRHSETDMKIKNGS